MQQMIKLKTKVKTKLEKSRNLAIVLPGGVRGNLYKQSMVFTIAFSPFKTFVTSFIRRQALFP